MPTPIVAMNRAIAIGERDGPEAGLIQLDAIPPALDRHARFHAARASMLIRSNRDNEARDAYQQAAEWSTSDKDRETYKNLAHESRMPPDRGPSGL